MSRMLKFLKQTAQLERVKLSTEGTPVLNVYGEPEYEIAKPVPCRREKHIKDVMMSNGATVQSSTQYYTVAEVGMNDRLDGKVVLTIKEYVDGTGNIIGYRSMT